ncbi:hypothetical protein RRG08_043777 [Elysia crispata]|uniref:Uncharacterized protein n=1 Tax=Elysia crispata TaxID=231223 RepID=A0AAE1BAQ8_9GAST|nr:hypothetical protein RRG08_043777 [Elysia crispata]
MAGIFEDIQMNEFGQNDDEIEDGIDDEIDYDIFDDAEAETSFIITPADDTDVFTTNGLTLDQKILASAVDDYYECWWRIKISSHPWDGI